MMIIIKAGEEKKESPQYFWIFGRNINLFYETLSDGFLCEMNVCEIITCGFMGR